MSSWNIVLIGFMGSGKTTVGREVARRLGWSFVDTDDEIERGAGKSIAAIFADEGEDHFRRLEKEVVCRLAASKERVIATGGGVVKDGDNLRTLAATGVLFWLRLEPEEIYRRIRGQQVVRPLLEVADPLGEIRRLLQERESSYAKADFIIDGKGTVDAVADAIIAKMNRWRGR
ncbi:MAG: shikimate kinase [Firmicutes bacterium]|nr:shikimate kinase [Bacillota bacterium]